MVCDLSSKEVLYHMTNNANDSSGNGYNLTANGTPTFINDKNAVATQAVDLDSGDSYETNSYVGTSGDLSYSWWTNWKSGNVATAGSSWLFVTGLSTDANKYPLAVLSGNTTPNTTLYLAQNDGTFTAGAQRTVNNDGNWHHYVAIRHTSGTKMELWEDGVLLGTDTVTARNPATPNRLTFNGNLNATPANGLNVTHSHDEIIVFHRKLDSVTITELFNGYDNPSCGYSNKVNGITPSKINGIAVANISKFNGV